MRDQRWPDEDWPIELWEIADALWWYAQRQRRTMEDAKPCDQLPAHSHCPHVGCPDCPGICREPVPVEQLVGILGDDWTGGQDSVEFIRSQRGNVGQDDA